MKVEHLTFKMCIYLHILYQEEYFIVTSVPAMLSLLYLSNCVFFLYLMKGLVGKGKMEY